MARPVFGEPQQNARNTSENYMTERAILYQRYLEHYQRQLEDEDEEEEEEHVHALDLRICKVNESISRHNAASNIWNQNSNLESTSTSTVQNPNLVAGESSPNPQDNPVESGSASHRIPGLDSGTTTRNPSGSPNRPGSTETPLPPLVAPTQSPPR